jgi:hypothetical protein
VFLFGCGGGGKGPTSPSDAINYALLRELNADYFSGKTVRWSSTTISVYNAGVPDAEAGVLAWSTATNGLFQFQFVSSPPAVGITIRTKNFPNPSICGGTPVSFTTGGVIVSATIEVDPIGQNPSACVQTVTHEMGHALGLLGHTHDGGLMDPNGGNGQITEAVKQFFRDLYSLPPGTDVSGK